MRYIIIVLGLAVFLETGVFAQNHGVLFSSGTSRGTYRWQLSAERMLGTPEWTPEEQGIPLPPDKAGRLGQDWLTKNGFAQYSLHSVEVLRYPKPYVGNPGEQLRKRFYYRLTYDSPPEGKVMQSMYVYVLLDGTVLEPTLEPSKSSMK